MNKEKLPMKVLNWKNGCKETTNRKT